MDNFRRKILKIDNGGHLHRIRNSIGIYDIYKMLRKNKWLNIGRPLTEHEFYTIIRQVNNDIADNIKKGNTIELPSFMGTFETIKYKSNIKFEDGKLKTNLPIDWNKTIELWYEDKEAYKNRTLVKMEEKELFKIFYNKGSAEYINKSFYQFKLNRELKLALKQRIKNNQIDACTL